MGRAKHYLSSRELILLYNALVLPHLNYCAVIWGRNYPSNIKKINMMQKRALRIIDKKHFIYPTNELFIKHKLLKFNDIIKEQSIMILLAYLKETLPTPIANMLKCENSSNPRQHDHFVIPFAMTNYRMFSLSCSAPRYWNKITTLSYKKLDDVPRSKTTLKKKVREFLINTYQGTLRRGHFLHFS